MTVVGIIMPQSTILAQGAQDITITGTVTDASTGGILPGANILVQGTYIGTVTDLSGNYTINVPDEQAVLVFSYIGYEPLTVTVGSQRQINVTLQTEAAALEEVVVVGYGTQKKESVVGSISQVSGDEIRQNIQGGDFRSSLRGSIPGLTTLRTTGRPGGMDFSTSPQDQPIVMFIRGKKTWNDASPLVLVDGVEREIHNVNPYEVEQISILKDASATAVFGVKGANGVILITTARGREGKAQISFNYTSAVKSLSRIADKAQSYEANKAKNYAILHEVGIRESSWGSITPEKWVDYYKTNEYPEYFPDIDWVDELFKKNTIDHNANLTISGGTKLVKYHNSIGYLHETDIINQGNIGQGFDPSFNFKRLNLRSNLDFMITPTTTLSTNLAGSYFNQRRSRGGLNAFRGIWGMAPDIWPIKYRDGVYAEDEDVVNAINPIWDFNYGGYTLWKNVQVNMDYILTQKLDFLTKGLSATARLSYDNTARTQGAHVTGGMPARKYIYPNIVDDPRFSPNLQDPELAELEAEYTRWYYEEAGSDGYDWVIPENNYGTETVNLNVYRSTLYEFSLNYNRDFGKHAVTGMALMNRQIQAYGSEFASYREDWVGRATYGFDRRYLFEVNAAYNGSEKFSRNYRFGFFPSVALGWVVSNESFFEPVKSVMNNLKFRYSDGQVGSDAGINRWLYTSSWVVHPEGEGGETAFYFGAPYAQASYPLRHEGVIANPDIQWETARKRDFGVETGFFNNQVRINFDYFIENRSNIFVAASERVLPNYFGAQPVAANIGKVDVKGWELETQFIKTTIGGFSYWASFAWTLAKDKIIEKGDPVLLPDYQKQAGYQIDQQRVIMPQGDEIMQTWNDVFLSVGGESGNESLLPGDGMRIDYNSDGIINNNDIAPYGFPARPQYSYAPSAGISYKGFSANVRFYGVYNVQGGVGRRELTSMYTEGEATLAQFLIDNTWSPERGLTTNAPRPAFRFQSAGPGLGDAYSVSFADWSRAYLRLESAEIAYTLNSSAVPVIGRMGISNIRFTLSGNNLLFISDMVSDIEYAGESGSGNALMGLGTAVDTRGNYPVTKRINLGISINF